MLNKSIIFIPHEGLTNRTGATIALLDLMSRCKVKNAVLDKLYQYNKFIKIYYFIKHGWNKFDSIYIMNTVNNLDLAIFAFILNRKVLLIIHETEEFIGDSKLKNYLLGLLGCRVLLVDRRLKNKFKNARHIGNLVSFRGVLNSDYNFNPSKLRYCVVGSIDHNKRQLLAIDIFKSLLPLTPSSSLTFIGKPQDEYYKELVVQGCMGIDCKFYDEVNREILHSKYDVLVACSKYESYGLAVAEAISLGKPVIIFNKLNYPNLNLDNDNVFEFKSITSREICKIINLCYTLNTNGFSCVEDPDLSPISNIIHEYFNIDNCF